VTVLYDVGFQALSTVFKGACDDKQGCGIGLKNDTPVSKDNEKELRLKQENYQLRLLKEEKTL
jgi:hypothetical protein